MIQTQESWNELILSFNDLATLQYHLSQNAQAIRPPIQTNVPPSPLTFKTCNDPSGARTVLADKAGQKKKLGEVVPFQSWEEFLGANADIVRDFKYDNKLKGSSSVMGSLIWNSETFWALPPGSPLFATKLFRYATTRIQKTGRGTS